MKSNSFEAALKTASLSLNIISISSHLSSMESRVVTVDRWHDLLSINKVVSIDYVTLMKFRLLSDKTVGYLSSIGS